MPNQLIQMMMNQLRMRNPQIFNQVEQLRKNNGNPMELLKQITGSYDDKQMENLWQRVKQFGIPDETIKQVQQEIITK